MTVAQRRIVILISLAVVAYLPALRLPFIADDYSQIPTSVQYSQHGWIPLWHDVNLRTRATYAFLNAGLARTFGFHPLPFYAASLLLHVLCVLLVYASSVWSEVGEARAFWAACFFAIYEGHQEAVMWTSASSDLLVFLFGMAAWVCWVRWLQGRGWAWYAAALTAFLLATASKESAWVFPVLMVFPLLVKRERLGRAVAGLSPFFAIAAIYVFWTWASRVAGAGYQDIRFSLSAPWPLVLLNSFWRLLFVWGLIALAVLAWARKREDARLVWFGALWMTLGLLPYSFLTYMLQVPSRSTYIASSGLAWIVGTAAARLSESGRRAALVFLCGASLLINLELLWVKKMSQFRERAEPSELLKQAAREAQGPVYVDCSPLPEYVTYDIMTSVGNRAIFRGPAAKSDPACFEIEYKNRTGAVIGITRRLGTQKHGVFY